MKSFANKLSTYAAGVAVAAAVAFAPTAYAQGEQIGNWQLALPGGPTNINLNNLSFNGASSIVNTVGAGGDFTFTDNGVFNITQKNGGLALALGGGQLTLNYIGATGSGNLNDGTFSFNGTGVLEIYYNTTATYGTKSENRYGATDGVLLASFQQLAGPGGSVKPDGTPGANGDLSLYFQSTFLRADTWYDSTGAELPLGRTLGFVTSNASQDLSNTCPGVKCTVDPNLLAALGGVLPNNAPANFLVVNGGQVKLDVLPVPEPATLGMMGMGLAGLALVRRRQQKQNKA